MKSRLLLLLLLFSAASYADDAKITIKQKSGNETILKLSTNPIITFSGETMVVTNEFITIIVPLDDIDSYVVKDGTTGIEQPIAEHLFANGHVIFHGLPTGTPIYVYALDGRKVSMIMADYSGKADVSLEQLPKGTYIINALKNSIKVINK